MVVDFGAGIYTCRERLKKKGGKVRFFKGGVNLREGKKWGWGGGIIDWG